MTSGEMCRALPQHSEHHAYTALTPGRFKGFFRD